MLSSRPVYGALLAVGMHVLILAANFANLHPAFDCGQWQASLIPFNGGLIMNLFALWLHPAARRQPRLLSTLLNRVAAREWVGMSVLVVPVLSPLLWHFMGVGHQKLMSGMYDMNHV